MTTDTDPTLCSGEYADAPFCAGPSDQGEAVSESGPGCAMDERSARGYCPDESDGHAAELCGLGIANDLCPDVEEPAPRDDGFASECDLGFDYVAGTCIEATIPEGDTITEAPATPPVAAETLPEAGGPFAVLFVVSAGLAALGAALVRLGRR